MKHLEALTGNKAVTVGAALCRPDLIAAYPITPQSSVVEGLANLVHNGELASALVQVESEHSAMSVVQGAAAAGGRVFTATSAQGLALMYEPYFRMSTLRFPMVMAIATREMTSPETIWSGQQDAMSVRESGWIQIFCDSNQEILDMMIQGYMLSEHKDVLLPVNICYDGFYSSHLIEGVDIPTQEQVDAFLPAPVFDHARLDPVLPMALDPLTPGNILMKYRKSHLDAMNAAIDIIDEIDQKFAETFGRFYGGCLSKYRCDDADVIIITIAGMTGAGMDAVDIARNNGIRAGLIKLRVVRPFPAKKIAEVLSGKKAFAVIDRSVCFGWSQGPMHMEVKAALAQLPDQFMHFSVIGGLGGADISVDELYKCIEYLELHKNESGEHKTQWLLKD